MTPEDRASRIRIEAALSCAETATTREESTALRAESRQVRKQARAARQERNVLLESAASIVGEFLGRRGYALAEPVSAQLRTTSRGSTGVDVSVKLEDPSQAVAVQAAIQAHFGDDAGVDILRVV